VKTDQINLCTNEQIGSSYLKKYGYLADTTLSEDARESTEESLKSFQRFLDLPESDSFDSATVGKMKQPRSGNIGCLTKQRKDNSSGCNVTPQKSVFTYSVLQYSKTLNDEDIDNIIKSAFAAWCLPDFLCFKEAKLKSDTDIKIYFVAGPQNNFDGKWDPCSGSGATVSYTKSLLSGEIYFDDHESWALSSSDDGVDLLSVAIHEIGYAIGLPHSNNNASSMYPIFDAPRHTPHQEDVIALGKLYGNLPFKDAVYCNCTGAPITDIPGKPNKPDGTCTGQCAKDLEESLNDRRLFFSFFYF
jgi:hypothetical protein